MHISDKVNTIKFSGIRKFFDLVQKEKNIVSLGVGEPDFDTPEKIKDSAIKAIENGFTKYTSNYGLIELREKISYKLKNENKISYDPEKEILITSGTSEALDLAFRAILNNGDEVIIPEPAYVSYIPCTLLSGAVPVCVPCKEDNNFKVRPEDIEKKITKKTKCIVLASPNNPTGAVLDKKDFEEIADIAIKKDLIVISDEIYEKLIYDGRTHHSIGSFSEMKDRTITINGFSKVYASTGWRVGYAAANSEIIEAMMKIHQYTMLCASSVSQYAMLSLDKCENYVSEMVKEYEKRRNLMVNRINEIPKISCIKPAGAFYIFVNIKKTNTKSEIFCEKLLKEGKVAVVPGNVFGDSGEGYIRMAYSVSLEQIEEALDRISRFMKNF